MHRAPAVGDYGEPGDDISQNQQAPKVLVLFRIRFAGARLEVRSSSYAKEGRRTQRTAAYAIRWHGNDGMANMKHVYQGYGSGSKDYEVSNRRWRWFPEIWESGSWMTWVNFTGTV